MSTFHAPTLIEKKRDGHALTEVEIRHLVEGYTRGDVPDYQMAAWAMAVYLRGMDEDEATALTLAMARSGQTVEFAGVEGPVVDKHSTGGVGDKVSLVLIPLAAADGLKVAKLSGRGLGHTGGTIDKLESVPGFRTELSVEEMVAQVNRVGMALTASTHDLAPADKRLYALRDVTATVGSLPLIASSIMSKKLAVHSDRIVLDVKVGRGALMKSLDEARTLARLMVRIGTNAGRATGAFLTDMNQPLGRTVGNALEVREALETLQGRGPDDLSELCLSLTAQLAAPGGDFEAARKRLARHLADGSALARLRDLVEAQGGDVRAIDEPDRLPAARDRVELRAGGAGYVRALDALAIGEAAGRLGAGRAVKGESIDHAVGIVLHAKVGERVDRDALLATLHVNDRGALDEVAAKVQGAYELSETAPGAGELIYERITA